MIFGVGFWCFLFGGFGEDEAVVEEEVDNHNDEGIQDESAGRLDEFVGEREVDGVADVESELIKRGNEAEKLGEERAEEDAKYGVPDEKAVGGEFGDFAFLPGDFGMGKVGDNSGDDGGDEGG